MLFNLIAKIVLVSIGIIDLSLTYYYVKKYKEWKPERKYRNIERNPLLVLLWKKFGLKKGSLIGIPIILFLLYIIGKDAHWIIITIVFLYQVYALYKHNKNISLLKELIKKYPSGKKE